MSADVSYIGWWGVRANGKWHLVESEVTDRLVMRCGRQMPLVNASGILIFERDPAGERCHFCSQRRTREFAD